MPGSYYHWTRRTWFDRMGVVALWVVIITMLLGGVAAGYALALLLDQS